MVERLRATQTCNSLSDNRSSAYSSDTEDSCGGNASALMFAPLRFHGLSNRTGENNCFMNAVVQCLLHVPTFVHGFMLLPHRCLDEKCVPCTFRKLMHKYVKDGHQSNAVDQEKLRKKTYVVNGTQLRQVISDACVQKGLFQVQEMNDAMEACEELLKLLGKGNTAVGATEESTSGSAIESVFTSRVITYGCCNKCGAKRREMQYAQIIQYIRAANLAKVGLAAELMNQQSDVPHSCDQSGCTEGMVEYLRIVPTTGSALLLGVIWRVKCSREDLKEFIQALPQAITSQDIQGKLARWNRPFRLRGFVAFAALHYVAFVRKGNADDWILFDDANVKERGNWENVIDKLVSGKLQPLILFYDSLDIMVNNTQDSSPIPKESAPSTSVSDGYLSKRGSQPLSPLKNSQGARPTSTFEVNSPHPSSRYTDRGQVTHSDFGNRPSESPNRKNPGDHSFNASFYYKARVDERKKSLLSTKEQMRMLSYSHSHHSPKASPKGERGMLPHAPHQTTDSKRTLFADLPRSPMHPRPQPVLLPKNRPVVMPSDFVSSPKNVDVAPLVSTRIRSPRQHTDGAPFSSMSSAYRHTNTAFTSTSPQSALSPRNCYSHGEHLKSPVNAGRVTHIVSSPSNYHGLGSSRSVNEIMNSLPAQHYTSYRMQEVPLSFPKPIPHSPLASTAYPYASSASLKSPHSRTRGQIGNSMHYGADVTSPHRIISPRGDAMRQGGQSPFSSRNFMESSSVKHKPTRTVQFESNATQQKDQTKALNYFSSRPFYSML